MEREVAAATGGSETSVEGTPHFSTRHSNRTVQCARGLACTPAISRKSDDDSWTVPSGWQKNKIYPPERHVRDRNNSRLRTASVASPPSLTTLSEGVKLPLLVDVPVAVPDTLCRENVAMNTLRRLTRPYLQRSMKTPYLWLAVTQQQPWQPCSPLADPCALRRWCVLLTWLAVTEALLVRVLVVLREPPMDTEAEAERLELGL